MMRVWEVDRGRQVQVDTDTKIALIVFDRICTQYRRL